MQKGNAKTKPVQIVNKPILRGKPISRETFRMARSCLLYVVLVTFIYTIFGSMMVFDSVLLRAFANVALVLLCGTFLYMSGATRGESDASFAEIMYKRKEDGAAVSPADEARCFHPLKGFAAAFFGALPFVLAACVLAILAREMSYTLGALPNWVSGYERQSEIGNALAFYHNQPGMGALDYLRVFVRASIMPFVSIVSSMGYGQLLLVERLSPLLVLIAPMGYGIGYAQGLRLRSRVHTAIAENERKKRIRDKRAKKKAKQARAPKQPEQLV